MKVARLVFLFLVMITHLSCTKEVDIEIPYLPSKPVVNCFFNGDSLLKLRLSNSVGLLDSLPPIISNATITLYENSLFVDTLAFNNGFYISKIVPIEGRRYSIKVKSSSFTDDDSIYSSDILPGFAKIKSLSFRDSAMIDQKGYPISEATIEIEDNSSSIQYYEIILELSYLRFPEDTIYEKRIADYCIENFDPVITREGLILYKPKALIFSNYLFAGQCYKLKINFQNTFYLDDSYPQYKELRIIAHLKKISEPYYNYKRQLIIHQNSMNSDYWTGTSEPSTMYSNIEGGYGIFAGYNETRDTTTRIYY